MNITSKELRDMGVNVSKPAKSKYQNVPTVYRGVRYVSKAEAAYAAQLDDLVAMKIVKWWIKNASRVCLGVPENVYVPDFLMVTPELTCFVDVKGVRTAKFRRDVKLWKAYGPCPLAIVTCKNKNWDREWIVPATQPTDRRAT